MLYKEVIEVQEFIKTEKKNIPQTNQEYVKVHLYCTCLLLD